MERWQIGDIIYHGDIYTGFIDIFKISHLSIYSCSILVARTESLFTGAYNTILISNNKNEDIIFSDSIYSCNVDRVYEFIQKYKESF